MTYIDTKQHENVWESKVTYQENVLVRFENLEYLKTGLEQPKIIKNDYFESVNAYYYKKKPLI